MIIKSAGVQFRYLQKSSIYLKEIESVWQLMILFKFLEVIFICLHSQYLLFLLSFNNCSILMRIIIPSLSVIFYYIQDL